MASVGLNICCVPHEQLDATVQGGLRRFANAARRPATRKRSFNMDTAHQSGIAGMGHVCAVLAQDTDESRRRRR